MHNRKHSFEELKQKSLSLDNIESKPRLPLYVIVENIRSLHNVGSIFRTADGLRFSQVILTGYTGRPPRKEIDKAALGAVESVPWQGFNKTDDAISYLKRKRVHIIGLEQTENSVDFQEFVYPFPVAIIVGNEFEGIEQNTLDMCDDCVDLPMLGVKQSLNVSTAFGVMAYELYRQFRNSNNMKLY